MRPSLRVLYLFAGPARKSDVRSFLEELCGARAVTLTMSEIDICRDPSMDLLDSATADRCLHEILNSEWDVVLVTPPCSFFQEHGAYSRVLGRCDRAFTLWDFRGFRTLTVLWWNMAINLSPFLSDSAHPRYRIQFLFCLSIQKIWARRPTVTRRRRSGNYRRPWPFSSMRMS